MSYKLTITYIPTACKVRHAFMILFRTVRVHLAKNIQKVCRKIDVEISTMSYYMTASKPYDFFC